MNHESQTILFALLALFCLLGLFFVSALGHVTWRQRRRVAEAIDGLYTPLFWKWYKWLCGDTRIEVYQFCLNCTRYILTLFYIILYCATFGNISSLPIYFSHYAWIDLFEVVKLVIAFLFLAITYISVSDIFPRTWAFYSPSSLFRCTLRPAGFFLLLFSPISVPICRIMRRLSPHATFSAFSQPKEELIDLVGSVIGEGGWTENDKRLFQSVLNFRNRIAREIMRPRVGLFCVPENLTLKQAAEMLQREGYSRVPVYRETIDTITGVLYYKDVLSKYVSATETLHDRETLLASPVKMLVKPVFYCPETKKIASLLQEFKKRKTHLAVIVDEYGGTAGLVTIEDILEEIVGEISDEYDEQESLFHLAPGGGWIVDARMNLLDVEAELGVNINQEEDYDTLAGYIFYRVGSIPQAGLILHHDRFEIEVLKSNDRMVEEVRITPIHQLQKEEPAS